MPELDAHLANIAANLQLVADLAYGDVALVLPSEGGALRVVADARPSTAFAPVAFTRVGTRLRVADESEAFEAWNEGVIVTSGQPRTARGIAYETIARPVGSCVPADAVIVLDRAEQVTASPGAMEVAFMQAADELLGALADGPLTDVRDGSLFSTERRPGDGVMRVDSAGVIVYASPNAVNTMRLAGVTGPVVGLSASALPGGGFGIAPVVGTRAAIAVETEIGERVLAYRSIALSAGVLVLVDDRTETRRREAELKVKDATIREVHHRVKNNLQTIASLLRIQARRAENPETRDALAEANERIASMAVVHDLLAAGDEERIDFAEAASRIVNLVAQGLMGENAHIDVRTVGETRLVDARAATSLALALAELVHNAIAHGLAGVGPGTVTVTMRRDERELLMKVADDGVGLPTGFDPAASSGLGLSIVRTVVEDDLRGTIAFSGTRGTTVSVRIPVPREDRGV